MPTPLPIWHIADAPMGFNGYDFSDALEWSLRSKSKDHTIAIPPSRSIGARERWQLSRTIEIPRQHGGWVWFMGQSNNNHAGGLHCSIEWAGDDKGPMFLYSSTDWKFSGSPKFYGAKKCPVGFLTTKNGTYNAGRMDWDGASWLDFTDVGIQCGRKVEENSNECNYWGAQGFHDCPVGFRVVGHQALQQRFRSFYSNGNVGIGIQCFASGCIYVDECYFNGLLLELNAANRWPGGDSGKSTGKNNGLFTFCKLKCDTQAAKPQLIRVNNSLHADVVFDTGILSGGYSFTHPIIEIQKNTAVTCRNLRMGGLIQGEGGTVTLDTCRRYHTTGTFADDASGVTLIQRGCLDYDGRPFPEPQYMTQADVNKAIADSVARLKVVSE